MLAVCSILLCVFVTYIYYIHSHYNYVTQSYVKYYVIVMQYRYRYTVCYRYTVYAQIYIL